MWSFIKCISDELKRLVVFTDGDPWSFHSLESELTDPRFDTPYWKDQINLMLKIGKKAEQQAFAGKGLDYVTDTYLPERLTEMGVI